MRKELIKYPANTYDYLLIKYKIKYLMLFDACNVKLKNVQLILMIIYYSNIR